jgi:hypothetical protein
LSLPLLVDTEKQEEIMAVMVNISKYNALFLFALVLLVFGYLGMEISHLTGEVQRLNSKLSAEETQPLNSQKASSVVAQVPPPSTQHTAKKLESMFDIGSRTKTDKIYAHHYERYYERFLSPLRTVSNFKMLEIGFLFGQSFEMWKQYFPLAKIYFMEPTKGTSYPESRFKGDSSNTEDLSRLLDEKHCRGELDLIIDDGAHHPQHQITAFEYLFQHGLKPGGIYIIEDIETSYWYSGNCYGYPMAYGQNHPDALITRVKPMVDVVNRKFSLPENKFRSTFSPEVDKWVSGIFFGMNTVIITKATQEEKGHLNAGYGYQENLVPVKSRIV